MNSPFATYVVELRKLTGYCLSDSHPRGLHKARVFRSRLGLTSAEAEVLQQALLDAVRSKSQQLRLTHTDEYGKRYILDFEMTTSAGTATIRSAWIAVCGQDVLQLTTCFVL